MDALIPISFNLSGIISCNFPDIFVINAESDTRLLAILLANYNLDIKKMKFRERKKKGK